MRSSRAPFLYFRSFSSSSRDFSLRRVISTSKKRVDRGGWVGIEYVVSRSTAESKIKESCWLGTEETVRVYSCQLLRDAYVLSRSHAFP